MTINVQIDDNNKAFQDYQFSRNVGLFLFYEYSLFIYSAPTSLIAFTQDLHQILIYVYTFTKMLKYENLPLKPMIGCFFLK